MRMKLCSFLSHAQLESSKLLQKVLPNQWQHSPLELHTLTWLLVAQCPVARSPWPSRTRWTGRGLGCSVYFSTIGRPAHGCQKGNKACIFNFLCVFEGGEANWDAGIEITRHASTWPPLGRKRVGGWYSCSRTFLSVFGWPPAPRNWNKAQKANAQWWLFPGHQHSLGILLVWQSTFRKAHAILCQPPSCLAVLYCSAAVLMLTKSSSLQSEERSQCHTHTPSKLNKSFRPLHSSLFLLLFCRCLNVNCTAVTSNSNIALGSSCMQ